MCPSIGLTIKCYRIDKYSSTWWNNLYPPIETAPLHSSNFVLDRKLSIHMIMYDNNDAFIHNWQSGKNFFASVECYCNSKALFTSAVFRFALSRNSFRLRDYRNINIGESNYVHSMCACVCVCMCQRVLWQTV